MIRTNDMTLNQRDKNFKGWYNPSSSWYADAVKASGEIVTNWNDNDSTNITQDSLDTSDMYTQGDVETLLGVN